MKTIKIKSKRSIKKIYIIDYANIMHILNEKYKNIDKTISLFGSFVISHLKKGSLVYIVSKTVVIDGRKVDIQAVFKERKIPGSLHKNLIIYNLVYSNKISSSMDDLLGWSICLIQFMTLVKFKKDPKKYLVMLTNDRQFPNKNLLGFTEEERSHNVQIDKDLSITTLDLTSLQPIPSPVENQIKTFLAHMVNTESTDTKNLECNLSLLVQSMMGMTPDYTNDPIKTTTADFTLRRIPTFSYNFIIFCLMFSHLYYFEKNIKK